MKGRQCFSFPACFFMAGGDISLLVELMTESELISGEKNNSNREGLLD